MLFIILLYLIPAALVFVAGMGKVCSLDEATQNRLLSFIFIIFLALVPGLNMVLALRTIKLIST